MVKRRGRPPLGEKSKVKTTIRLPRLVVAWFRATGPGWQRRLGDVLEAHIASEAAHG